MTGGGVNGAEHARINGSGRMLIGTTTDNGVDKLQVSGSMNVSTLATTNNLSVTTNATVGGTARVIGTAFVGGAADNGVDKLQVSNTSAVYTGLSIENTSATLKLNVQGAGGIQIGTTSNVAIDFFTNNFIRSTITSSGRTLLNGAGGNNQDYLSVAGSVEMTGMKQAYVAKTGAYTATFNDYVIDCTSGTFTVTLPTSSSQAGRILIIKNSGAGTITVDGNASETIDGATTVTMAVQYGTIQIMSDGTNWKTIAKF
jgi:hypothetical protein